MRVALDTNRYSDLGRGEPTIAEILESADEIVMPFVVVAELRAGFAAGLRAAVNDQILSEFLHERDVIILFPDDQTILHYASLYRDLRTRGKKIPINDLWIAAIVIQHGLHLCTRDAHFDHLPQIPRV